MPEGFDKETKREEYVGPKKHLALTPLARGKIDYYFEINQNEAAKNNIDVPFERKCRKIVNSPAGRTSSIQEVEEEITEPSVVVVEAEIEDQSETENGSRI